MNSALARLKSNILQRSETEKKKEISLDSIRTEMSDQKQQSGTGCCPIDISTIAN